MESLCRNDSILGCDVPYEEAKMVVFGAPFDGTTSNRPGTRFASTSMRQESLALESYSPYLDKDLSEIAVHDAGDLTFGFGNPAKILQEINGYVTKLLKDQKLPVMIGGEHLVTLGAVAATWNVYPDLHLVHFDAHADLRQDYLGEELSHATVIRRCYDILGRHRIFQFGIRSGTAEEFAFARKEARHLTQQKFNFKGLADVMRQLANTPIYLTIDLDVLDPSIFPGTGTPEAGGVTFDQLREAILLVGRGNVVACDVNELSPPCDTTGVSTAVACKVLRELLLTIG